ncbi:MAG: ribosome-inactivating family protein [Spiroplasma phoeniceum]|nr:MAG: ribosome-inactivating family protein [Spiroplasma phoeniceum]UZQ32005.1 MAG: ribosome-inactivating family protein [Spiroplasma phoeniceum]
MKKLLSLLSALTISGTAAPTTVAASPYAKQEKLSTNINLQTNNLKRKKRQQRSREIFQLTEKLIIDRNNPREYRNSFQSILESLSNNNILRIVYDDSDRRQWGENSRIFTLNSENYGYFKVPVSIRWTENNQSIERNLELFFRTDNLYFQGFIVSERESRVGEISTYYHFDFSNIDQNRQPQAVRDGSVPLLQTIQGIESRTLTGISPDYRDMIPTQNNNINWESIFNSFLRLTNDINVNTENSLGNLARSLGQVTFVTSEAMRFPDIYARIASHLITRNESINLERNQRNEIYRILVNWSGRSRNEILQQSLIEAINNVNNPNWVSFSMEDLTRQLNSPSVQVLLGYINFRFRNAGNQSCNRRQARELTNNNYWHEKFCDLKPEIDKIQEKITAIKILDENTQGGNLKSGTIYVGTDNGVYLIYPNGKCHKFDNLNFEITSIKLDGTGSAYVTNNQEEVYHLNLVGWGSEKIERIESSNLEKELKIYYDFNKENMILHHQILFVTDSLKHYEIFTFELKSINPLNYKKIEFMGNVYSDKWGVKSSWGSWISDGNRENYWPSNHFDLGYYIKNKNNNLHNIIQEKKITALNMENNIEKNYSMLLEKTNGANLIHTMWYESTQRAGLTWYKENDKYYLQFITYQYLNWQGSISSLDSWLKIGNGIRLYND